MFKKLDLYLVTTILGTLASVLVLLVGIDLIFTLINEVRDIGTGDYTYAKAALYFVLGLPQKVYEMFPMSALIGTLLGLGVLASHSELIAMQSLNFGVRRITRAIVLFSLIMAGFVWVLGEGVAPYSDSFARGLKSEALSGGQTIKTAHGTWLRDGHAFVHIRNMYAGGHLEGVTRYEFDKNLILEKAVYASYADYINDHWVLKDIQETHFYPDRVEKFSHESQDWKSVLSPKLLSVAGEKYLERLSMSGLWHTIQYRSKNGLDVHPFLLAFWQRLIQPISVAVMMFLAVPFIFGPLRSSTMGLRLVLGILMGFSFHTFNEMFGQFSLVYRLSPLLGATIPTALFFGIGIILLKRVRA